MRHTCRLPHLRTISSHPGTPTPLCAHQVGQEIEVRPGIVEKTQDGKLSCRPIFSRILSLFAEQNDLQVAGPGGLIGTQGGGFRWGGGSSRD